jgi:hypothetical protein
MRKQMTKREARELLGVPSDYALSQALGISHQAVYLWGKDDDPIPLGRAWQVDSMAANHERAVISEACQRIRQVTKDEHVLRNVAAIEHVLKEQDDD